MFKKTESVQDFKALWSKLPVLGEQISFSNILIEAKLIKDNVIFWEEVSWTQVLSKKAQSFLAKSPTFIGTVGGINFYENPILGDESPLIYIGQDRKVRVSDFHDFPSLDEVREVGLLHG